MKELIDISVIIPCFNRQGHIQRAMLSVLNQEEYRVRELLIFDDFSSDESVNRAEALRPLFENNNIDLFISTSKKNFGPSYQRNRGIKSARGKYLAFLDSDDYWDPKKLMVFREDLFSRSLSFWACGHSHLPSSFEMHSGEVKRVRFWQQALRNHASCSSVIIEKSLCPYFREDMKYCEDYELFTRISFKASLIFNTRILTYIDRPVNSEGGLSSDSWKMRLGEMQMYVFAASYSPLVALCLPLLIIYSLLKQVRLIFRGL